MNQQYRVQAAVSKDAKACVELIYMTMGSMGDYLFGADDIDRAKDVLAQLFVVEKNRYSYEYATLVKVEDKTVGLLLSYSGADMKALELPMAQRLLAVNSLWEMARLLYRGWPLMMLREVAEDEYFINNVAVFPKHQGGGIGSHLMGLAEAEAKLSGLRKCALTVGIDNSRAINLYNYLGYQIVDTVKVNQLEKRIGYSGFYRMVKELPLS